MAEPATATTTSATPASGAAATGSTASTGGSGTADGATGASAAGSGKGATAGEAGADGGGGNRAAAADAARTTDTTSGGTAGGTGTDTKTPTPTPTAFDAASWDGDVDALPETVRDLVRVLATKKEKLLEAGYTKKFQKHADDVKTFDATKETATKEAADLRAEIEILRAIAEGQEDPRLAEAVEKAATLTAEIERLTGESTSWKTKYEAQEKQASAEWVASFNDRHKDVLADTAKKQELHGLIGYGWEPDAAVELLGATDEVKRMAEEVVRKGTIGASGHSFAVQYAKAQVGGGSAPRKPRPAATVTNGANGQANPNRVGGGSIRDMSTKDARREAALRAFKQPGAGGR